MAFIKMRLDGADMMVSEEDCVWTKKNGKMHHIHTLGSGFSLFEFEGLEGTFEERLQQVKDNRASALENFPKTTIDDEPEHIDEPKPKQSTSDWLFDKSDWINNNK